MTIIWYASFAAPKPIGRVRVLSQHVALLREHGLDARLGLPPATPRPDWYHDDVPVEVADTVSLTRDDLLVIPEVPLPRTRIPRRAGEQ